MAAGFGIASEHVEEARREWFDAAPWAAWLVIPFGLTFTVLLTRTCFDGTAGSGIPLEMTAFILADGDPNLARIFSARIMVGKVALTLLGQLCGASSGREGPTVQVASSLLVLVLRCGERLLPSVRRLLDAPPRHGSGTMRGVYLRDAALIGGAAGVSGAFNTPLGGIIFAIEEMGGRFTKTLGQMMVVAVAVSGAAAIVLGGYHATFEGYDGVAFEDDILHMFWVTPVVSLFAGLLGGVWSLLLLYGVHIKLLLRGSVSATYAWVAGCGLLLAAAGYWDDGHAWGSGFDEAKALVATDDTLGPVPPVHYFAVKGVATLLTYWSGVPGGIFAPTISVGTGIGHWFHDKVILQINSEIPRQPTCLLAATAYFAGVTQSPISAFAVMLGMLDYHGGLVPAMLVSAVLGWLSAQLLAPRPLYPALSDARIPPLPPESCQRELRALPPPVYVSKMDTARHADFVEASKTIAVS